MGSLPQETMSHLEALKSATSKHDLAKLLHTTVSGLTAILYATHDKDKYTSFDIPKRTGGTRQIKAPNKKLKLLQQKLSLLLQDCLDEINKLKNNKDNISHGFKRNRSIISNAKQHRNRRWVFNLDLKDFFPSIHYGRVRGYFIHDKNFSLSPDIATLIAQIACDGNALPQGAPCSPVISNLVAHIMDIHIVRLASAAGCTYSRYADDLTFSTNKKYFPSSIAEHSEAQPHTWKIGKKLLEIITHSGFEVNLNKTRMAYANSRQEVTGLVVNNRINVRQEYRHNTRAMVHSLFRTGKFNIRIPVTKDGATTIEEREGNLDQLHGRLGFIDRIDLKNTHTQEKNTTRASNSEKKDTYRKFLIYRYFYAASKPVILCEGKTDYIYLKYAIRSLADNFPQLIERNNEGNLIPKLCIFKYTNSSTGRILGLKGGGSHLKQFVNTYSNDTKKFSAPQVKHPVIVLVDNDRCGRELYSVIKKFRKDIDTNAPFIEVVHNLYVMATPLMGNNKSSVIEDFFDDNVKGTVLDGKTLNIKNDENRDTDHYSKAIFAEKVVVAQAASIDFSGFKPILENICKVITHHNNKLL